MLLLWLIHVVIVVNPCCYCCSSMLLLLLIHVVIGVNPCCYWC